MNCEHVMIGSPHCVLNLQDVMEAGLCCGGVTRTSNREVSRCKGMIQRTMILINKRLDLQWETKRTQKSLQQAFSMNCENVMIETHL